MESQSLVASLGACENQHGVSWRIVSLLNGGGAVLFMAGVLFAVHSYYLMRNKIERMSQKRPYWRSAAGTLLDRSHLEREHIELSLLPGLPLTLLGFGFHICLEEEIGKVPSLCMYFLLGC